MKVERVNWSGNIPGYGDAARNLWAISVPNERKIVCSDGHVLSLTEAANNVWLSEGGQLAWQGNESNLIYLGLASTGKLGYGQWSFAWIGETPRFLETKEEYQATSGGWRYVDDAGNLVFYGSTYSGPPLWEYTERGDVTFGQGPENVDGVCGLIAGDVVRQITPGEFHNVRFRRYGDALVVCAVNYPEHYTEVWTLTKAELAAASSLAHPSNSPSRSTSRSPSRSRSRSSSCSPSRSPSASPSPSAEPPPDPIIRPMPCYAGFCWPLDPTADVAELPPAHLETFRLLGFTLIRIDAGLYNPGGFDLLRQLGHAGFLPLSVLAVNMANPDIGIADATAYAQRLADACPWATHVEVMNEPASRVSASDYARLAIGVGEVFKGANPNAHVILAGEMANFGTGELNPWWPEVRRLVPPSLYDGVAIHPYRNPKPWSFSAWGSRDAELAFIRDQIGDKALHVTETGWHVEEPNYEVNVLNDFDYWRRVAGAASVTVYAMVGERAHPPDWGLCENDPVTGNWTPNPAAIQLAHYFEEFPL